MFMFLLGESLDSQFSNSSAEDVANKFEDKFTYFRENVSELRLETVFRLAVFAKVDSSSSFFCGKCVVNFSQCSVECRKTFDV